MLNLTNPLFPIKAGGKLDPTTRAPNPFFSGNLMATLNQKLGPNICRMYIDPGRTRPELFEQFEKTEQFDEAANIADSLINVLDNEYGYEFDIEEPGYRKAMDNAFSYISDVLTQPVSFSLINELHKKCCTGVRGFEKKMGPKKLKSNGYYLMDSIRVTNDAKKGWETHKL